MRRAIALLAALAAGLSAAPVPWPAWRPAPWPAWGPASGLAMAQPGLSLGRAEPTAPPSGRLLVIDRDRVLSDSERGRAMLAELEEATAALEAENHEIEARLRAEERDLTERRPGMEPEAFRAEAEAFDERVRAIREERLARGRELLAREEALQRRFWDEAVPVLAAILQERGAVVVLDRESVFLSADSADITAEAIARIDAASEGHAPPGVPAPAVSPGGGLTGGAAAPEPDPLVGAPSQGALPPEE